MASLDPDACDRLFAILFSLVVLVYFGLAVAFTVP